MPTASNLRRNLASPLSTLARLVARCWPSKNLQVRLVEMGSGKGQGDASHCVCVRACLTGNLEHVIQGVLLPSGACVSGTEAGAAIGLHGQDNAAVESVCEPVKREA